MNSADTKKSSMRNLTVCRELSQRYIGDWRAIDPAWPTIEGGAYVRLSTDEQAEVEQGSLENQVHFAFEEANRRAHALRKNLRITKVYLEEPSSGTSFTRTQLLSMIADMNAGKTAFIVTKEVSRLARHVGIMETIIEVAQRKSILIVIPGIPLDEGPMTYMLLRIFATFSQMEVETTKHRIVSSIRIAMRKGKFNSTHRILGLDPRPGKPGLYQKNQEESLIVDRIFNLFLETQSVELVLDTLLADGIKNKNGQVFKRHAVQNLLTNTKLISEWNVNVGGNPLTVPLPHEPVISKDKFVRVQEIVRSRKRNRKKRQNRVYPLSGLLVASGSSEPFRGFSGTGRSGERHFYYRSGKSGMILPCAAIESLTLEVLNSLVTNDDTLGDAIKRHRTQQSSQLDRLRATKASLKARAAGFIERKSSTTNALAILITRNVENVEAIVGEFNRQLKDLDASIEETNRQLVDLEATTENIKASDSFAWERISYHLPRITEVIRQRRPELLKPLLQSLFEKIEVQGFNENGELKVNFVVKGEPRGPFQGHAVCGNLEMVEAEGIEPSSAKDPQPGATFLVYVLILTA